MKYQFEYDSEAKILSGIVEGSFSFGDAEEYIAVVVEKTKEYRCNLILTDMRKSNLALSTMDIYELPKLAGKFFQSAGYHHHLLKRALVIADNEKDFKFFETVTANNGQRNKLFMNIEEARKWLLSE